MTGALTDESLGPPSHRREIQRQFWVEHPKGLLTQEAAHQVGVFRQRLGRAGSDTVVACPTVFFETVVWSRPTIRRAGGRSCGGLKVPSVRQIAREVGRAPSTISPRFAATQPRGAASSTTVPDFGKWKGLTLARRAEAGRRSRLREYVQDRLSGQWRDGITVVAMRLGPVWPDFAQEDGTLDCQLWDDLIATRRWSHNWQSRWSHPPGKIRSHWSQPHGKRQLCRRAG